MVAVWVISHMVLVQSKVQIVRKVSFCKPSFPSLLAEENKYFGGLFFSFSLPIGNSMLMASPVSREINRMERKTQGSHRHLVSQVPRPLTSLLSFSSFQGFSVLVLCSVLLCLNIKHIAVLVLCPRFLSVFSGRNRKECLYLFLSKQEVQKMHL